MLFRTNILALVSGGQGKRLMDSIRAEMGGFVQLEETALAQHEAEVAGGNDGGGACHGAVVA